ncbi:ubiquitin-conjugating enzyme/RWD-like protein [Xylariomycetidae sp. FL2044]|nr:ubiquitin-conjugating enzyme/RWD-like protein [Xylariomycetidae sp. FL2044]
MSTSNISARTAESSSSSSSSRTNATKRLLRELAVWEKEGPAETGIERLGPVEEDGLLRWEAVINGRGVGCGYEEGRWLLQIEIPPTYPLHPPKMTFRTPVVHPNIAFLGAPRGTAEAGEICLDLLKDKWTPAYSVLECVRAVRMLLGCPETDSPLNVDVAALIRGGDAVGARRLVEFWCRDEAGRYEGR